jgi:hypothetical protein
MRRAVAAIGALPDSVCANLLNLGHLRPCL